MRLLKEKLYIEKYCEFFKMAFAKILDFRRRLKTRSETLKRLRKSKLLLCAIFSYPIFNFADILMSDPTLSDIDFKNKMALI